MSQSDFIKDIAKHGLVNDREKLLISLNELIEHSKNNRRVNFALQLQSILKESIKEHQSPMLTQVGSSTYLSAKNERDVDDLILEKITSDYRLNNLIGPSSTIEEIGLFIEEHRKIKTLREYGLPVSNKILFHGPSGCGKTLASYVIAGELEKMMYVVNLGAIVSSKLGETSKNLSKLFKRAASEKCIIFLDEFDSVGRIRNQENDHGEMKRVVNTILQLFDYLPQESIVICATNLVDSIDNALLRRFDTNVSFELPSKDEILALIKLTLQKGNFKFDAANKVDAIIKTAQGLSYYTIQMTLISAIKRSVLSESRSNTVKPIKPIINTALWHTLVKKAKSDL